MTEENKIAETIPSLGSSAWLVDLNISVWTGRKLDKRASEAVEAQNKTNPNVANVHKKLLGKCDELVAIQKFVANARNIHYSMTMPWSDMGMRLVTTRMFPKYHKQMTEFEQEFIRLAEEGFFPVFGYLVANSQTLLGDLHNKNDYPTLDELRRKFSWRLDYVPLPDAGDFRVDIGNEAQAQLQEGYKSYYATMFNKAKSDLSDRLIKPLKNMSERLDYADDEDKKIFRDTLVDNVMDILDLVKTFDHDTKLTATCTQIENALMGITPDALREDSTLRAETKKSIDDAIKSLPSLDF